MSIIEFRAEVKPSKPGRSLEDGLRMFEGLPHRVPPRLLRQVTATPARGVDLIHDYSNGNPDLFARRSREPLTRQRKSPR
jgi:hypothetical protein